MNIQRPLLVWIGVAAAVFVALIFPLANSDVRPPNVLPQGETSPESETDADWVLRAEDGAASQRSELEPRGSEASVPQGSDGLIETGGFYVLRGRCVDGRFSPVAGVCIEAVDIGSRESGRASAVRVDSGPDGLFSVVFKERPSGQVFVVARKEGYTTRRASSVVFSVDQEMFDVGDVTMHPSFELSGIVTTAFGEPLKGVFVGFSRDDATSDGMSPDFTALAGATTDEFGRFKVEEPLRAGEWGVVVKGNGIQSCTPSLVNGSEGANEVVSLVCSLLPGISGIVLCDGDVVPGVYVQAIEQNTDKPLSLPGLTDEHGEFSIEPIRGASKSLYLELEGNRVFEADRTVVAWGDKQVLFQARKKPWISLTVIDGRDGSFVREYGVSVTSERSEYSIRATMRTEGAERIIDGVPEGTSWLYINPGLDLAPRGPFQIEGARSPRAPLVVEVSVPKAISVVLSDAEGTPVGGAQVTLIGGPSSVEYNYSSVVADGRSPYMKMGEPIRFFRWDERLTNTSGVVNLRLPNLQGWTYYVHARARDGADAIERLDVSKSKCSMTLPYSGVVAGSLIGTWPGEPAVFLESEQEFSGRRIPPNGGVEPNDYEWLIRGVTAGQWKLGVLVYGSEVYVSEIEFKQGGCELIVLDSEDFLVPTRQVAVFQDETPITSGVFSLRRIKGGRVVRYLLEVPVLEGVCELPPLPRWDYQATLRGTEKTYEFSLSGGVVTRIDF